MAPRFYTLLKRERAGQGYAGRADAERRRFLVEHPVCARCSQPSRHVVDGQAVCSWHRGVTVQEDSDPVPQRVADDGWPDDHA